nr:OmpA family protein [uncultured Flavobacterium sp.]
MRSVILFLLLCFKMNSQEKIMLYFDLDQDQPNVHSQRVFQKWLDKNKEVNVIKIEGYCDSTATNQYNKQLALRRAVNVQKHLIRNNFLLDSTLVIDNIGEDFLGATQEFINRKVIVYYQKKSNSKIQEVFVSKLNQSGVADLSKSPKNNNDNNTLISQIQQAKVGDFVTLQNINFKFNSEVMVNSSMVNLDELLQIMRSQLSLNIEIHGHICCNPDPNDVKLSNRRAKSVHDYLIKNGIQQRRLAYKGYGSNKPIFTLPEKNEIQRAANRRVEILILQK